MTHTLLTAPTETATVFWLSRHNLSPAQVRALRGLHGKDVRIETASPVFESADGLADVIRASPAAWVYAVAGPTHYLVAALAGLRFGVFENHPQKRADGTFGLQAVYHIVDRQITRVWENPDPLSDEGERLYPSPTASENNL
jgi:hypothetical protein